MQLLVHVFTARAAIVVKFFDRKIITGRSKIAHATDAEREIL